MQKEQAPVPPENEARKQTFELFKLIGHLPIRDGLTPGDVIKGLSDRKKTIIEGPEKLYEITSSSEITEDLVIFQYNQEREEVEEKRNKSDYKTHYFKLFESMMSSAKTTNACKTYLSWVLDHHYDIGVHHDFTPDFPSLNEIEIHEIPDEFGYLVFDYEENPESGGIFSNNTAEQLEMKIYNKALAKHSLLNAYIEMTKNMRRKSTGETNLLDEEENETINEAFVHILPVIKETWDIPIVGESVNEIKNNYDQLFDSLRIQIENHYGIIPHTEFSDDPKYFASKYNDDSDDN